MSFSIKRGKQESLCESCSHGTVSKGPYGTAFHCNMFCNTSGEPHQPIRECTSYELMYNDEPYEMTKKAWILEVKGRQVIGFKPPKNGVTVREF